MTTATKPFCLLRKTSYTLRPGTADHDWQMEKAEDRMIDEETYQNIVDATPFLLRIGRTIYQECDNTPAGYVVTRIISRNPARNRRTVREFIFDGSE